MPPPTHGFVMGLMRAKSMNHRRRWTSVDGRRIYEWDSQHGELEVYNKRGKHLGAIDPENGAMIKQAVEGRTINV